MRWQQRLIARTWLQTLIAYLLLSTPIQVQSKVILEESAEIKFYACIQLIQHHPITLIHYPNFHIRKELQDEVNEYCFCQYQQENKIRVGEKYQSSLDWAFRDPSKQLNSKDKCSLETLELFSNETLYAIFYASQIAPFIENKLKDRFEPVARNIASDRSIESKLNCLSQNIFQKCGKIKSLHVTYQCVNDSLKDLEFISEIEKVCPEFSPDEIISDSKHEEFL